MGGWRRQSPMARGPGAWESTLRCPSVQKMVALGQGPWAAAGEGLQTLWLCAAHLLGPRLWITAHMRGG